MHSHSRYSQAFKEWLQMPAGKRLIANESYISNQIIPTIFGYDAVLLGENEFTPCLEKCVIKNQSLINEGLSNIKYSGTLNRVCSRLEKLPILTESIDLVYLAHCLEFSNNPHEVLREAYRILRPDGHMLLSMLNPISLWGMWRYFGRIYSPAPWRANFMSLVHLKDWLALLGFDIMRVNHFGFCLPVGQCTSAVFQPTTIEKYAQKMRLPCGAAYIVEVSKRVLPLTPIKPTWTTEEKVVAQDAAEPTV